MLDRFLPLWIFLAMAAGVARYSFLWKATWENSSRMVRWNRSQMPLVCGERAFVRVWSAAYRAGKEGVPRAGAQIASAAVVYRKKGFTVSLERDETTRRLAELLPTSVVGVEVKDMESRVAAGIFSV